MSRLFTFGENVAGYNIPVLNEREIRASAGIYFLVMFTSVMLVIFRQDFTLLKYVIITFLADFIIRVFVSPRFSPTLVLGRLIVRNQTPEYVGAKQKQFAWMIGVSLALLMFIFLVVLNSFSPITGITCFACLIFLFFESAFGICIGCKFYSMIYREKAQYCPGEVCDAKSRHEIQKTSAAQLLVVVAFIAGIFLSVTLFNEHFSRKPYDLFGINSPSQSK